MITDATLTVSPNSGPTPIGIRAPTDLNYSASQLAIVVTGEPSDGAVLLSNGVAVAVGQTLTVDQLTGLLFAPTAGLSGQSSTFTYTVVDPAGLSASGVETLAIGAQPQSQPSPGAGSGGIVGFALQNAGGAALGAHELTFNEVFAPGQVPSGSRLSAIIDGVTYAVQLDGKSSYSDGSVRSGLITLDAPPIAAGATLQGQLVLSSAAAAPAINISTLPASGYNLVVNLTLHNSNGTSTPYQLNAGALLGQALQAGRVSYWMQGPQATEARFDVPLSGSFHVTFNVTDFADGTTRTDVQFNNDYAMQAVGGAVTYDESITQNGSVVSQYTALTQYQYQTRHEVFWSNGAPQVNIIHDIGALERTGAVQAYDLGLHLDLSGEAAAMASPGWGGPLPVDGVEQAMPGTGGRPDIGSTTGANAAWLMTQSPIAAQYALGQADAAGSVPIHFYDPTTGQDISVFHYPSIWSDPSYGGTASGLTQAFGPTGWTYDPAHQPDLAYVAYELTGNQYYLDQLNAQADASIFGSWFGVKNQAGYVDIVANGYDQIRQQAWSLRQIDEAAWANPDGSPQRAYFAQVASDNWNYLVSQLPSWTAMEGDAHGYIPYFPMWSGMQISPWMEDYFATTVIEAAEQGNQNAGTVLNWMSNYLVGRFMPHTGWDPHDGVAYRNVVTDSSGNFQTTWAAVESATQAGGFSNGGTFLNVDYNELAMSTLAGIISVTGSPQAMQAYGWLVSQAPNLYSEPQLDIVPRLPDGNFLYSNQITIDTTSGNATLSAAPGTDSLLATSGTGVKVLNGGTGSVDLLYGGPGSNTLNAGTGNDYLFGGSGTNTFVDNIGNNYMVGNGSSNLYMFAENASGHDTIANFNFGTDHLRVAANLNGNSITTPSQLLASATFSNGNTVLHLSPSNDITLLGVSQPSSLINSILVS